MFYWFLYFFQRDVSEVRRPISAKFCLMFGSMFSAGPKIWGPAPPKKIGGEKHAKFGLISDPFPL